MLTSHTYSLRPYMFALVTAKLAFAGLNNGNSLIPAKNQFAGATDLVGEPIEVVTNCLLVTAGQVENQ
jgi:hypothetical protein